MEDEQEIFQGIAYAQQALSILRSLEDKVGPASALNILGELYRVQGDDESAQRHCEESLTMVKETGERKREAMLYGNLCFLACHRGEYVRALDLIPRSLRIIQDLGSDYGCAYFIGVAAGLGRWEHAARLLGGCHGRYEKLGSRDQPADQVEYDITKSRVRRRMAEEAFEAAFEEGRDSSPDRLFSIVFEELGAYALRLETDGLRNPATRLGGQS
jgi:tetratricopeptide (TPR) repeat protein